MATTDVPLKENICKPDTDKRNYRHVSLNNGLQALLVSDPESEKAAACLRVEIGSLKDPDDLPGLAHFCEHMLFLGTEKYPEENAYFEFVTQHGGSANACTQNDATMFFFDIAPNDLQGALDRFVQFFLHPLFNESATEREVMAVDSENANNFQRDRRRVNQVCKHTCKPGHPYGRFGSGNKDSLLVMPSEKGINVREELIKFHSAFYSSNLMSLCVLGRESLDELTQMVTGMFSAVENKDLPVPVCTECPFTDNELQVRIEVVPVKHLRELSMTFPIPDLQKHYRTKPTHYVAHLIGHEGPGSVLSVLKSKGWATGLCAGSSKHGRGIWEFVVDVDLTEEGELHTDDIVEIVFQYFAMLKREGPKEWIFKECANMNEVEFRFADQQSPTNTVVQMTGSMPDFPPEDYICGPYLMSEYNPELIGSVLDKLVPQNLRLILLSQRFRGQTKLVEPWYQVDYNMEKIDPELIKKWSQIEPSDAVFLPTKNEFIPDNFDLVPPPENPMDVPVIIKESPVSTLFYKHDDKFKVPKVYYRIEFASPLAYDTPENCCLLYLYVKLLQDSLNEYAYAAEIAGIEYKIFNSIYGLEVLVTGYSDKADVLMMKITERMTTLEIDPMKFGMYLDLKLRSLRDFKAEQPYNHAMYYMDLLTSDHVWNKEELLGAAEQLKPDDLKDYFPKFLRRLHATMLAYGNTTSHNALQVVASIENILERACGCRPLLPGQLRRKRQVQLVTKSHFLYRMENHVHSSSCAALYFQVGMEDTSSNLLLEMLTQVISEPCFTQLRTKEQLGYIVATSPKRADGVQGLMMLVQSPKHPVLVEERMESFLKAVEDIIDGLSEESFEVHKNSLTVQRTEKPKKLKKQGSKYWYEISSKFYHFKRDEVEVEYLQSVTKEDVLMFYKDHIAAKGTTRRKLTVHVLSKEAKDSGFEATDSDSTDGVQMAVVDDIQKFRNAHSLYPIPCPCVDPVKHLA